MTESEAIEILRLAYPKESNRPITEKVISITINALEEIQQYKELGTVEELMVEKEKQIDRATEIVKQGDVSDDVCEWKKYLKYPCVWMVGCELGLIASMQGDYCPYCGKKIKVVE